jgi:hypothetical protein
VRWYFPGRLVGLRHKASGDAEWKRAQFED